MFAPYRHHIGHRFAPSWVFITIAARVAAPYIRAHHGQRRRIPVRGGYVSHRSAHHGLPGKRLIMSQRKRLSSSARFAPDVDAATAAVNITPPAPPRQAFGGGGPKGSTRYDSELRRSDNET